MKISTFARRLLKLYRKYRAIYPTPRLARIHAYFKITGILSQTQQAKYARRYWYKPQ
jgi:hypothetical protein